MATEKSKQRQLASRIYTDILQKIVSREIPPGERLGEERLGREYHVSRTPIREALFALERDGLIERIHNCGAKVQPFTADDLEQIYDIRRALECLSIRRAARNLSLTELYDLEGRLEAVRREKGARLHKQQLETDLELHRLIVSRSGNPRLAAYLDNISLLLHSLRLVSLTEDGQARNSAEEHLGIVRALIKRDGNTAERLLAEHLDHGMRNVAEACFRSRANGGERRQARDAAGAGRPSRRSRNGAARR
jgi:DNA-binding GntR family transcriptional regulator